MTDQTRYRIVCADGRTILPDYPTAESAAEVVAIIDDTDAAGCGPHTGEPVEPVDRACAQSSCAACKSGKPSECAAPPYPGRVVKP